MNGNLLKPVSLTAVGVLILIAASCGHIKRGPQGNPANPIKRMAVLPMQNNTNDVEGPVKVREKIVTAFENHHYNVMPLKESDQLLRDKLGVSMGGQLKGVDAKKLGAVLGVDGVLYGTLMDFGATTTGFYNVRKVRAKLQLVSTRTDKVFWQNGLGVKSESKSGGMVGEGVDVVADVSDNQDDVPWETIESQQSRVPDQGGVLGNLAAGLGEQLVENMMDTSFERESTELANRITATLPMGPGDLTVAASVPDIPAMAAPAIPPIGFWDESDRDFSAVIHSSSVDRKNNKRLKFVMPYAKAGKKVKLEMDYRQMSGGDQMPAWMSSIVMIYRGDQKKTYSLYPGKKRYLVHTETDEQYHETPTIRKKKIGTDTVDGHPCDKYKVTLIYKDGKTHHGEIWKARDLKGLVIKSRVQEQDMVFTSILKNIDLKKPSARLFEIPADFKQTDGFMELMMAGE